VHNPAGSDEQSIAGGRNSWWSATTLEQTEPVPALEFPRDQIVGQLHWLGSWSDDAGPVLATGRVLVPDGVDVGLSVSSIADTERHGSSWTLSGDGRSVDLAFLLDLPPDSISSLQLSAVVRESVVAVTHLAPGLHHLTLSWADLPDAAISAIAQLRRLTYLQTFGNAFTDDGVQPLAALTSLESLYLEEETLSVAAFRFCAQLPALKRLGLQDVPLSRGELAQLKADLPGVDVG
jgi:hypothetical protein